MKNGRVKNQSNKCCLWLAMLAVCCVLTACGEQSGKSASSNKPYEVLLIGDSDNIIYSELSDTVEGLPQPEPSFDVTASKDSVPGKWQKFMRSIVIVRFDKAANGTEIDLKKDVYARPQIVLTITSPSPSALKEHVKGHQGSIIRVLNAFELGNGLRALKAQHNAKAEKTVKQMFGIDMLIPADMQASKRGKDFLWLSNNTNEGLENICIYRVRNGTGTVADKSWDKTSAFRGIRDSVMKRNIPGERNGMYMETASVYWARSIANGKEEVWASSADAAFYGLWDMHGDAMGGPFAAKATFATDYSIFIEGFVYAPESKKRNKLRRLEACLYSAKVKKQAAKKAGR